MEEEGATVVEGFSLRVSENLLRSLTGDETKSKKIFAQTDRETQLVDAVRQEEREKRKQLIQRFRERQQRKSKQREEREIALVQALINDLQKTNFRPTMKTVLCESERRECMQCYQQNQNNPLQCAELVQALSECAKKVQIERILSETR
eukprot:jgi/Galph1/3803/GphlegSOOS_G2480.1